MLVVVPSEEGLTMGTRVLDTAKAPGEIRTIFHGLELRLRVRIVVRDIGAAVALDDLQIDQQTGHRFGAHGSAPISMQSQLPRQDIMARHGVGDELLSQLGTLAWGDQPAHDETAEDVQNHVQMKARPLGRPLELGDVP